MRRATTGSGRTLWRMFFTGGRGELSAVGFAAADAPDGDFTPYLYNPIVKDSQRSRAGPTNVRFGDGYLLYFTQPTAKPAVGVAIDDAGVPSERF